MISRPTQVRLQRKTLHLLRQLEAISCDATVEGIAADLHGPLVLAKHHLRCWHDLIASIRQPAALSHQVDHSIRLPAIEESLRVIRLRLDAGETLQLPNRGPGMVLRKKGAGKEGL